MAPRVGWGLAWGCRVSVRVQAPSVGSLVSVGACSKCPLATHPWGPPAHAPVSVTVPRCVVPPSHLSPCLQHEEAAGRNHSLAQRVQDLEHRYSEASTLQHIQATLLYDMQAQINNISVLTDWAWRNPTCLSPAEMRLQEEMHHPGDGELPERGGRGCFTHRTSLKGGYRCGKTALNPLCIGQESDLTQPAFPRQPGGLLGAMDTSGDAFHAI